MFLENQNNNELSWEIPSLKRTLECDRASIWEVKWPWPMKNQSTQMIHGHCVNIIAPMGIAAVY